MFDDDDDDESSTRVNCMEYGLVYSFLVYFQHNPAALRMEASQNEE